MQHSKKPTKGERLKWPSLKDLKGVSVKMMDIKGTKVYSSSLSSPFTGQKKECVNTINILIP